MRLDCNRGPDYCKIQGETHLIAFTVTQDGAALDITNYTLNIYINCTPAFSAAGTLVNGAGGLAQVSFSTATIPVGLYDYQVTLADGDSTPIVKYKGKYKIDTKLD